MADVPLPPLIPGNNSLKFGATGLAGLAHPHATSSVPIGIFEGSLEVKPPTIWTEGKAEVGKSQRREEKRREEKRKEEKRREEKKREDQRRERVKRKKMQVRER